MNTLSHARSSQLGVTLIEVLVSVLILAVGLLGIAAMQATALRNSQSSFEHTQAVAHTYAAFDILRSRRDEVLSGAIALGSTTTPQCAPATASAGVGTLSSGQSEIEHWYGALKTSVGAPDDESTCAAVSCVGNAIGGATCTVVVQWDDSRGTAMGNKAGGTARKVTTVGDV